MTTSVSVQDHSLAVHLQGEASSPRYGTHSSLVLLQRGGLQHHDVRALVEGWGRILERARHCLQFERARSRSQTYRVVGVVRGLDGVVAALGAHRDEDWQGVQREVARLRAA